MSPRILVIHGHPDRNSLCGALRQRWIEEAEALGARDAQRGSR